MVGGWYEMSIKISGKSKEYIESNFILITYDYSNILVIQRVELIQWITYNIIIINANQIYARIMTIQRLIYKIKDNQLMGIRKILIRPETLRT